MTAVVPFTPGRRRGTEMLDDPAVADAVRTRSLRDVAISNTLFGGRHAVGWAVRSLLRAIPGAGALSLLDVGTGSADLPRWLASRHPRLRCIGLDTSATLVRDAGLALGGVAGSALVLPFRDRSVDVVLCSQLLHHFEDPDLMRVLGELDRVARHGVVVADLRRSHVAAAGFWVASRLLGFHPVTRHDGVVSVYRGFTADELARLIRQSTGAGAVVRRHVGYRLTAVWGPTARHAA